jgi:hypothetical protein
VSCIYEDYIDPAHVIELTSPEAKGQEGVHVVKDLKKNLMRAEKYDVHVDEVKAGGWKVEDRKSVEDGIAAWKASRSGIQIASTTIQPWLDEEHRRYWIARKDAEVSFLVIHWHSCNSVLTCFSDCRYLDTHPCQIEYLANQERGLFP